MDMMDYFSREDPLLDRYSFVTGDQVVGVSVVFPAPAGEEDAKARKKRIEMQLIKDVYAKVWLASYSL